MNEPVQEIRGEPSAQLRLDEPARLKNKIGRQVAQIYG